jgi:hypothetical protein
MVIKPADEKTQKKEGIMPGGDRTGPLGKGAMTGRQLGYGAGFDSPGYTKGPGGRLGRGFWGRGAGLGRGYGRGIYRRSFDPDYYEDRQTLSQGEYTPRESDINSIKSEVKELKNLMSTVMDRLESIAPHSDKK